MKIRFIGLVAHVLNSKGAYLAVLVYEADHRPRLIYEERDEKGKAEDKRNVVCEKLDNSLVTTSLTGRIDRGGLAGVPKLASLGGAGKNLHAEVENGKPLAGRFNTVVVLNGDSARNASYYVEDWFDDHGTFKGMFGTGRQFCMPQTVVLDIPTTSDVTVTITPTGGSPKSITFKPVATLTISNAEEKLGTVGHFPLFGTIFENETGGGSAMVVIQGPKPIGAQCTHGAKEALIPVCPEGGGQTVGVECSNSQYP